MKELKEKLQELNEKLPEKMRGDKKLAMIVGICVVGVLLIALSAIPGKPKANAEPPNTPEVFQADVSDYVTHLEERLAQLISEMDGAGKTRVMLTLESGAEEVYAADEQFKSSSTQHGENRELRFEYITLRAKDGGEQALLLTVVQPRVRGVAVVCEGGGSALVQTAILQTVTAVLDVSSARVSINKMQ